MNASFRTFMVLVVVSLAVISCTKKKSPTAPHDDNNGIPQGAARIRGAVHDASGAALSNVALHIVYDLSPTAASQVIPLGPPSIACLYETDSVLTTECGDTVPLPEGVMVKLFWDVDSDGPDSTDPQPTVCNNPPDCIDGPPGTVNFNEFPINGVSQFFGPGRFWMDPCFVTSGYSLEPSRFYARIYCSDGNILYESDVITLPSGPSEAQLHFHCTPCSGAPEVPEWNLDQPYPDPATDSVYVHFSMKESAQALVTLLWPGGNRTDTTFDQNLGSGGRTYSFLLGDRPNGLYTVRMRAAGFQADAQILKNVTDNDVLRSTDAAASSGSDGAFTFDAAAGVTIARRGPHGEVMSNAPLSQLKVVAIKFGYAIAETTFVAGSGQTVDVSLTLRTP
jgi:hypothetical protein